MFTNAHRFSLVDSAIGVSADHSNGSHVVRDNSYRRQSVSQAYADGASNTLGGDQWWDLWLALNPDATSPVNGPSDAQASISIPLLAGGSYKYYFHHRSLL